jgi:hypothetical protein
MEHGVQAKGLGIHDLSCFERALWQRWCWYHWTMTRGHGRGWPCHVMKRTKPFFGLHDDMFRKQEECYILA